MHRAAHGQPTSHIVSPLIPSASPSHGHHLFLGFPKVDCHVSGAHACNMTNMFVFVCVCGGVCMLSVQTASTVWAHRSYKRSLHCAFFKFEIRVQRCGQLHRAQSVWVIRDVWRLGRRDTWEVEVRSVQYILTWTMPSSHSGAEFSTTDAIAEALRRATSENSAGLHLGSK